VRGSEGEALFLGDIDIKRALSFADPDGNRIDVGQRL
jgi:hypothetical protein